MLNVCVCAYVCVCVFITTYPETFDLVLQETVYNYLLNKIDHFTCVKTSVHFPKKVNELTSGLRVL